MQDGPICTIYLKTAVFKLPDTKFSLMHLVAYTYNFTPRYYSATILVMSGASSNKAIWLATAVSTANTAFTFIGLFGVEKLGRKTLLMGSMLVMMLGLALLGVAFIVIIGDAESTAVTGGVQ